MSHNIENVSELDSIQMDFLTEMGNIGSGNAATALSKLLNHNISVNLPKLKILSFSDAFNMHNPEEIVTGVLVRFFGDIRGMILYMFGADFCDEILNILFNKRISSADEILGMDELEKSTLAEVGNIMTGAYLNAFSQMLGYSIKVSAPKLTVDMSGAIMNVPIIEFAQVDDEVLFIDDSFSIDNNVYKSNMMLIPEMESLSRICGKIGL